MPRPRRWTERRRLSGDDGSASLEFITAGLVLLVPLVYLVLALSALQGASLAVEGAARQAARVFVQAPDGATAIARVEQAVAVGLSDFGLDGADATVVVSCAAGTGASCLARGEVVSVTVGVLVALPLVPRVLDTGTAASIPVEASAVSAVSRFWSAT